MSILRQIAQRAQQDNRLKFTSLIHHVDEKRLAECYKLLDRKKACGIDQVTVESYGKQLKENLTSLIARMKRKRYRPKPVRRVYIPKPGRKEKRSLGIPSVEDKFIQTAVKQIIEPIYEADFLDCSYGFRPNRNAHLAIKALDKAAMTKPVNFVVEVDIRQFFDHVRNVKALTF